MKKPKIKNKPFIAWNYDGFPYLLLDQVGTSPTTKTEVHNEKDATYHYVPNYFGWIRGRLIFDAAIGVYLKIELEHIRDEHRQALASINRLYKNKVREAIIRAGGDPEQLKAFQLRKK